MMFPYLFSPLKIGTVEVKNRISFQPHLTNFAVDNLPSERQMYYWGERAKGGAGLIITEELTVHPTDMAYEKLIDVYHAEVIPGFKKITDYVHQYDSKIFAQLNHNGQQGDGSISRLPVWAPSPDAGRPLPGDPEGDGAGGHRGSGPLLRQERHPCP